MSKIVRYRFMGNWMTKSGTMLVALALVAVLTQECVAQSAPPTAQIIAPTLSRSIEVPIFNYWGESQCDGDGNMYFHSGSSAFSSAEIFELSKDGSTGKFLRPSGKFADTSEAEFDSFWVTGDGDVFVLAGHGYLISFDQNGTMKDPLTLQVPEDLMLTDLAAFDNGFMLVAGHYGHKSASHRQGEGYQAILTPSGQVVRVLSIKVPDADLSKPGLTDEGVAASRGNLYFLGPAQINVISTSGNVVRALQFRKPDKESAATKIYVSAGIVVIALSKIGPDQHVSRSFLVLDDNTGEVKGYYQMPPDVIWVDVCLTRSLELVFLAVEQGKQKIVTARIR